MPELALLVAQAALLSTRCFGFEEGLAEVAVELSVV